MTPPRSMSYHDYGALTGALRPFREHAGTLIFVREEYLERFP